MCNAVVALLRLDVLDPSLALECEGPWYDLANGQSKHSKEWGFKFLEVMNRASVIPRKRML
jgi:hypothetical protein